MSTASLPAPPDQFLTVDDVAHLLQTTPAAVHRMRHRGYLPPAFKVGRILRWDPADITTWLNSRKTL
ncbi:putative DNA binding protein [Gordonia phage GMA4]|uniref:putative DNA binding protein n=1 Tax=Gordonia phage GMA4 TaxID=1647471 RepID=UPI0006BC4A41|nr:putative DNA binding protein [Gordonia phage GMA4]AKJ72311.1 putative DNA binding protein [Gordonia phage GMA4]